MFHNLMLILGLAVIALWAAYKTIHRSSRRRLDLVNGLATGTHEEGVLSKTTDAALGRYRLVIQGASATSVAVAGTADRPIGVTDDETVNTTDQIAVKLLNCTKGTVRMVSDGTTAIAYGDLLVPGTAGGVRLVGAGAGNFYIVGRALEPVSNGATDVFEVSPCGYGLTK